MRSPKSLRRVDRAVAVLFVSLLVLVSAGARAAEPSLADVLTTEEFERAGLEKLTPEELAFLSARMLAPQSQPQSQTATPAAPAPSPAAAGEATHTAAVALRGESAFGQEQKIIEDLQRTQVIPKEIRSSIAGPFRGESGRTVFRLENGPVWRQTDGGTFAVNMNDPVVTVERGTFGTYFLRVEGYRSRTKVRRLE